MLNFLGNKKGGEKYLSIWWFFVLIVIATGIVISVIAFNISDISTKKLESEILIVRVINCLIDNGYINEKFFNENFDIFKECYLSKEVINEGGKYYLALNAYNFESCKLEEGKLKCENPINPTPRSFGVARFEVDCELEGKYLPECSEKYVYVLNKNNEKLIMHVVAGSNQVIKKEAII